MITVMRTRKQRDTEMTKAMTTLLVFGAGAGPIKNKSKCFTVNFNF